jgi:hypothetical protein
VELNAQEVQEVQGGGWFRKIWKEIVHEERNFLGQLGDFFTGRTSY